MKIHYDVDAMVRKMQADCERVVLPPTASDEERLILRNRAVQHEMIRAILTEENRGTPTSHQMHMIAWLVAETLSNVANTYTTDVSERLLRTFIKDLELSFRDIRAPQGTGDIVTSVLVPTVQGGHA